MSFADDWAALDEQGRNELLDSLSDVELQKLDQQLVSRDTSPVSKIQQQVAPYFAPDISGMPVGERLETHLAGVGSRFAEAGTNIKSLFARSPEEAQLIREGFHEDEAARRAYGAPQQQAAYQRGKTLAQIGEIALGMRFIPGLKFAESVKGFLPNLGRAGLRTAYAGAVGGAYPGLTMLPQPGETKTEQVMTGLKWGAGLGLGAEAISAAARPVAKLFTNTRADTGGILTPNPAYEAGVKLQRKTGVEMTPGQITGSEALSEMRPPRTFINKQAKQTLRYFVKLRDRLSANPKESPELARRFEETTDDILSQLRERRRIAADYHYNQRFKQSVKGIYPDSLMGKLNKFADDAVPGTEEAKLIAMRDKLASTLKDVQTITPEQFLGWHKRFNAMAEGKSDIFKDMAIANQKRIGGELLDSLYDDIAKTSEVLKSQGNKSPAVLLDRAVESYRKNSIPIQEIEDSALGAAFRRDLGSQGRFSPEEMGKKLMSLEPSQYRAVYGILNKYYPHLAREYQATKLFDALRSGVKLTTETAGRPAGLTKFNPPAVLEGLTRKGSLRPAFEGDPKLLRRVNNGVALLDRISDRIVTGAGGKQALASKGAEGARNIFSMTGFFIAGYAAKTLGPIGLWKLTSTSGGQQILRTLATAPLNSPKMTFAIEAIEKNYLDESRMNMEKLEQERE